MLTLKQIYDDKEKVIAGLEKKHFDGAREAIEQVIALDKHYPVPALSDVHLWRTRLL